LIHCLLARIPDTDALLGNPKQRLIEKYIRQESGISRAYIFGYDKDDPSYEHLKTEILGDCSNQSQGVKTLYTSRMDEAKKFLSEKVHGLEKPKVEEIFG